MTDEVTSHEGVWSWSTFLRCRSTAVKPAPVSVRGTLTSAWCLYSTGRLALRKDHRATACILDDVLIEIHGLNVPCALLSLCVFLCFYASFMCALVGLVSQNVTPIHESLYVDKKIWRAKCQSINSLLLKGEKLRSKRECNMFFSLCHWNCLIFECVLFYT